MSWEIINQILGLASIDKKFAQELLEEPLAAVQRRGFQLTPEEQQVFGTISAHSLHEFVRRLIQELKQDQPDQD
ncbi:MAG TPA: Os1348 family NHLP clan protein [Ktedonobacteraceae bacterium]|nr:Os1348 family NHLP clan protein [Ktedonobacteraceae bacterium]